MDYKREIRWGTEAHEAGRKTYSGVSAALGSLWWKVTMLPFEWAEYWRDGELVKRVTRTDAVRA